MTKNNEVPRLMLNIFSTGAKMKTYCLAEKNLNKFKLGYAHLIYINLCKHACNKLTPTKMIIYLFVRVCPSIIIL